MHSFTRTLAVVGACVSLTVAASSGTAVAARATPPPGTETYENSATLRCMDDSAHGFRTFPCNGLDYQWWKVVHFGDGTDRFQNVHTGRCIFDGDGGFGTLPCDTSRGQKWYIHSVGRYIAFKNQDTGDCIDDSNGSGFRTTTCNWGPYQTWG